MTNKSTNATVEVTDAIPLQGLAAYLRCEAGRTFQGSPNWQTLLQWANEVDAAQSRTASAQGGGVGEASDVIARSKRILGLVDDYHDKPTNDTRAALRHALMDEFTATPATAAVEAVSDAERYRLLRRGQHWSVLDGIGATLRAEALDAAIDAIRADRKG